MKSRNNVDFWARCMGLYMSVLFIILFQTRCKARVSTHAGARRQLQKQCVEGRRWTWPKQHGVPLQHDWYVLYTHSAAPAALCSFSVTESASNTAARSELCAFELRHHASMALSSTRGGFGRGQPASGAGQHWTAPVLMIRPSLF